MSENFQFSDGEWMYPFFQDVPDIWQEDSMEIEGEYFPYGATICRPFGSQNQTQLEDHCIFYASRDVRIDLSQDDFRQFNLWLIEKTGHA